MKYQVTFSLKKQYKVFRMSSTAVMIGALRVKFQKVIHAGRALPSRMLFVYIKFDFIYHDLLNYNSTRFLRCVKWCVLGVC